MKLFVLTGIPAFGLLDTFPICKISLKKAIFRDLATKKEKAGFPTFSHYALGFFLGSLPSLSDEYTVTLYAFFSMNTFVLITLITIS